MPANQECRRWVAIPTCFRLAKTEVAATTIPAETSLRSAQGPTATMGAAVHPLRECPTEYPDRAARLAARLLLPPGHRCPVRVAAATDRAPQAHAVPAEQKSSRCQLSGRNRTDPFLEPAINSTSQHSESLNCPQRVTRLSTSLKHPARSRTGS
jgi:hypothetical protein